MTDDFQTEPDELEAGPLTLSHDPFALQRQRAVDCGGFLHEMQNHVLTWLPNGGDTLVISFDNLAAVRETQDRTAWGQKFLLDSGFDLLGVQIKRRDWYRDAELIQTLEDLRNDGFFQRYSRVATFGASMGGFAALTFAPLVPGCIALAFAPQRSLSPTICPWETRYRYGRTTYWDDTLPYGDAAQGVPAASRAYICFDPFLAEDRRHASELAGPNVRHLPMPHLGHKLPPALLKMGLLKPLALAALADNLDRPTFARMMRARRDSMPWRLALLQRALDEGHIRLGLHAANWCMADRPNWRVRHLRNAFRAADPG